MQSFELDDVHRAGVLHVGAVVLPALIAVAELKRNLSGKEFLAAAAAGYESGPRVGLCMGPEHIGQAGIRAPPSVSSQQPRPPRAPCAWMRRKRCMRWASRARSRQA